MAQGGDNQTDLADMRGGKPCTGLPEAQDLRTGGPMDNQAVLAPERAQKTRPLFFVVCGT